MCFTESTEVNFLGLGKFYIINKKNKGVRNKSHSLFYFRNILFIRDERKGEIKN